MPTAERKKLALENRLNSPDFVFNEAFQREFLSMVQNEFLSRGAFINRWMDPRRDYNRECGYPETYELTSEKWMDYYGRRFTKDPRPEGMERRKKTGAEYTRRAKHYKSAQDLLSALHRYDR